MYDKNILYLSVQFDITGCFLKNVWTFWERCAGLGLFVSHSTTRTLTISRNFRVARLKFIRSLIFRILWRSDNLISRAYNRRTKFGIRVWVVATCLAQFSTYVHFFVLFALYVIARHLPFSVNICIISEKNLNRYLGIIEKDKFFLFIRFSSDHSIYTNFFVVSFDRLF